MFIVSLILLEVSKKSYVCFFGRFLKSCKNMFSFQVPTRKRGEQKRSIFLHTCFYGGSPESVFAGEKTGSTGGGNSDEELETLNTLEDRPGKASGVLFLFLVDMCFHGFFLFLPRT